MRQCYRNYPHFTDEGTEVRVAYTLRMTGLDLNPSSHPRGQTTFKNQAWLWELLELSSETPDTQTPMTSKSLLG